MPWCGRDKPDLSLGSCQTNSTTVTDGTILTLRRAVNPDEALQQEFLVLA